MNSRAIRNPNFGSNKEFYRSLVAKSPGARDYPNTHTEVEHLGNGKFAASVSVGHRVFFDKADGNKPKKHKLTDARPSKDYVLIQGVKCCVEIHPSFAKFFDVQHEEERCIENWVVRKKAGNAWQDLNSYGPTIEVEEYPESAGDVVKVTVSRNTDYGTLTVEYFQRDGNDLKHNVTFKNTSGETGTFRVAQKWTGLICDAVKIHGRKYSTPVKAVRPSFIFGLNDGTFKIRENLGDIYKQDKVLPCPINPQNGAADFVYGDWELAAGEELQIDPDTATLDDPTVDGTCSSSAKIDDQPAIEAGLYLKNVFRAYIEWDVSGISVGSDVTDTVFKYHGVSNGVDCHIHEMVGTRPSTGAAADVFAECGEGTVYADPAGFPVAATNQSVDLGTSADSDLESQLSSGWFAIGIQGDAEDVGLSDIWSEEKTDAATPKPTLYVVYTPAAPTYRDIDTRFKLGVQAFTDIATRFKLAILNYKDAATRFKLGIQAYQDIPTRFKLGVQAFTDVTTRFKLWALGYKDTATRFLLTVGVQAYKDTSTRFKLWVQGYQDVATRFKLDVQAYQDITARFRLWVRDFTDVATRLKLIAPAYGDVTTRFRLTVRAFIDTATRYRLTVQAYLDITTLFRLVVGAYTDIVARFRLSVQTHRDTSTRFFLHQPTWEEFEIQKAVAALRVRIEGLELEPRAHFRI